MPVQIRSNQPLSSLRNFFSRNAGNNGAARQINHAPHNKKAPTSGQHPAESHRIHVHGMWYRPEHSHRSPSENTKFETNLATAWLTLHGAAQKMPPNADAHLWVERKSVRTLYTPFVGPNGNCIEIPHSMLDRRLVSIHLDDEIDAMINAVPDRKTRRQLRVLNTSPMKTNIGIHSDMERSQYGYLYTDGHNKTSQAENSGTRTELNVHIDIDTLSSTEELTAARQVMHKPSLSYQNYLYRPLAGVGGGKGMLQHTELERHKLLIRSMGMDLKSVWDRAPDVIRNGPAEPTALSKKPARTPESPTGKIAVQQQENKKQQKTTKQQNNKIAPPKPAALSKKPVPIPKSLLRNGIAVRQRENDYLATVQGHPRAFEVVDKIADCTTTGKSKTGWLDNFRDRGLQEYYRDHLHRCVKRLSRINGMTGVPDKNIDQKIVIDYFRLAAKIVALAPSLKDKMAHYQDLIASNTLSAEDCERTRLKISAYASIYGLCGHITESACNAHTYLPFTHTVPNNWRGVAAAIPASLKFKSFSRKVFGAPPPMVHSGGWQFDRDMAKNLGHRANLSNYKKNLPLFQEAMKEIKLMLFPGLNVDCEIDLESDAASDTGETGENSDNIDAIAHSWAGEMLGEIDRIFAMPSSSATED